MRVRKTLKKLVFGRIPGLAGRFTYFGTEVYFAPGSLAFEAACDQGIYEHDNVRIILGLAGPGSVYFDVGGNIGLMAVPVLAQLPEVRVVSFEPSPNSLPYLQRTRNGASFASRWEIVATACGAERGTRDFHASGPGHELLDGFVDTGRGRTGRITSVTVTTLDEEWRRLGKPRVSVIKIDVEGAEISVLNGALECLAACRPSVLLEWSARNLSAYGCSRDEILGFARLHGFSLLAAPSLAPVLSSAGLLAHMAVTESFLLSPTTE